MKKARKSVKAKIQSQYRPKLNSKIVVKKQRVGVRDIARKIRPLNDTEKMMLDKALRKMEKATLYSTGYNRIENGFAEATMVDSDKETIDVVLKYGVRNQDPIDVSNITLNRKTLEAMNAKGGKTEGVDGKYQVNVHGEKPTDFKILCRIIRIGGKDVQVCYHERNDHKERGVEVYSGKNYIVGSNDVSYSKKYDEVSEVPVKYKAVVDELVEAHHKKWDCGCSMEKGGKTTSFNREGKKVHVHVPSKESVSKDEWRDNNFQKLVDYAGKSDDLHGIYKSKGIDDKSIDAELNGTSKQIAESLFNLLTIEELDELIALTMAKGGEINKGQVKYFIEKFRDKMNGSPYQASAYWVDGIGELNNDEKKLVWKGIQEYVNKSTYNKAEDLPNWIGKKSMDNGGSMATGGIIEYSVVGQDTEEHFEDMDSAVDFYNSLTPKQRSKVQFFSKEWNNGEEGEVIILRNKTNEKYSSGGSMATGGKINFYDFSPDDVVEVKGLPYRVKSVGINDIGIDMGNNSTHYIYDIKEIKPLRVKSINQSGGSMETGGGVDDEKRYSVVNVPDMPESERDRYFVFDSKTNRTLPPTYFNKGEAQKDADKLNSSGGSMETGGEIMQNFLPDGWKLDKVEPTLDGRIKWIYINKNNYVVSILPADPLRKSYDLNYVILSGYRKDNKDIEIAVEKGLFGAKYMDATATILYAKEVAIYFMKKFNEEPSDKLKKIRENDLLKASPMEAFAKGGSMEAGGKTGSKGIMMLPSVHSAFDTKTGMVYPVSKDGKINFGKKKFIDDYDIEDFHNKMSSSDIKKVEKYLDRDYLFIAKEGKQSGTGISKSTESMTEEIHDKRSPKAKLEDHIQDLLDRFELEEIELPGGYTKEKALQYIADNLALIKKSVDKQLNPFDTYDWIERQNSMASGGDIKEGKNGYVAFYKDKQMDVWGDTSLQARDKAAAAFKARKAYDVTVVLAEKDGEQVTHLPLFESGGSVTMGKLNEFISKINEEGGGKFWLEGSYGQQDLWAKDKDGGSHRIESGSKKDIYEALIRNRFNKKYNPKYADDKMEKGGETKNKWEGVDADLETSLEEYGFATTRNEHCTEPDEHWVIYKMGDNAYGHGYIQESFLDKIINGEEWADKDKAASFLNTTGMTKEQWLKQHFVSKLSDLFSYWGWENIMGMDYSPNDKEWAYKTIGIENGEMSKGGKTKGGDEYILAETVSGDGYSDPTFTLVSDLAKAKDMMWSKNNGMEGDGYVLDEKDAKEREKNVVIDYNYQKPDDEETDYYRNQLIKVPAGKFHLIYYTEPNEVQVTSYSTHAEAKKVMKKELDAIEWQDADEYENYDGGDSFGEHGEDGYVHYQILSTKKHDGGGGIGWDKEYSKGGELKTGDYVSVNLSSGKHYGKILGDYTDRTFYVGHQYGFEVEGIGDRLDPERLHKATKEEYEKYKKENPDLTYGEVYVVLYEKLHDGNPGGIAYSYEMAGFNEADVRNRFAKRRPQTKILSVRKRYEKGGKAKDEKVITFSGSSHTSTKESNRKAWKELHNRLLNDRKNPLYDEFQREDILLDSTDGGGYIPIVYSSMAHPNYVSENKIKKFLEYLKGFVSMDAYVYIGDYNYKFNNYLKPSVSEDENEFVEDEYAKGGKLDNLRSLIKKELKAHEDENYYGSAADEDNANKIYEIAHSNFGYDAEDHEDDHEWLLKATPEEAWQYWLDVILPKLEKKKMENGGKINSFDDLRIHGQYIVFDEGMQSWEKDLQWLGEAMGPGVYIFSPVELSDDRPEMEFTMDQVKEYIKKGLIKEQSREMQKGGRARVYKRDFRSLKPYWEAAKKAEAKKLIKNLSDIDPPDEDGIIGETFSFRHIKDKCDVTIFFDPASQDIVIRQDYNDGNFPDDDDISLEGFEKYLNDNKKWEGGSMAKGGKTSKGLPKNIERFLAKFPDNATSWDKATDEIREIARTAREYYNGITLDVLEEDPKALQPLDFRSFKTPSQWNTQAKKFIRDTYAKMNDQTKIQFNEMVGERFIDSMAKGGWMKTSDKEWQYKDKNINASIEKITRGDAYHYALEVYSGNMKLDAMAFDTLQNAKDDFSILYLGGKKGSMEKGGMTFVKATDFGGQQYYTIGKYDEEKALYNDEEVALLKDGYSIELELRAQRHPKEKLEGYLSEIKEKHPEAKLVFSDNEYGGNWRIYTKGTSMAKGGIFGSADVLLKDEGDFFVISSLNDAGLEWMEGEGYKQGETVHPNNVGLVKKHAKSKGIKVEEFSKGGKVNA